MFMPIEVDDETLRRSGLGHACTCLWDAARPHLNGSSGWFRVVAVTLSVLALVLFAVSIPPRYHELRGLRFEVARPFDPLQPSEPAAVRVALAETSISTPAYAAVTVGLEVAFALAFSVLAIVIARRTPRSSWSRVVALTLVVFGTAAPPTMGALAGHDPLVAVPARALFGLAWALLGLLFFMFPDGRVAPSWARPFAIVWFTWTIAVGVLPGTPLDPATWPATLAYVVYIGWFAAAARAQVQRYRYISTAAERQQTKWVMLGLTIGFGGALAAVLPDLLVPQLAATGTLGALGVLGRELIGHLFVMLVPLTLALAILRYRLWEIDLLIGRALVYVPLTAIVAGVHLAFLGLFQRLVTGVTGNHSELALVLAALVVGAGLTPLKNGLQSVVDHRFKEPAGPARELRAYQEQVAAVAEVLDLEQASSRLLDLAVAAVCGESGAIYLNGEDGPRLFGQSGAWDGQAALSVPLEHRGTPLGVLALGPHRLGLVYTPQERELLEQTAARMAHLLALLEGTLLPLAHLVLRTPSSA